MITDKFSFEIRKECEIWFDSDLIRKGDDIADYFLEIPYKAEVDLEKIDLEWNQEEYDSIFNKPDN